VNAGAAAAPSIDRTFAALADPTRRGVVELLREKARRAGELAVALDMSPPAMSRHLRVLRKTGLVDEEAGEDDARVRVYRLCPEPFANLRAWLDQVEGYWADQLGAFKTHAEATRPRGDGGRASKGSKGSKGSKR
jgi:DNA-binding transcriptional ArsR family regulator